MNFFWIAKVLRRLVRDYGAAGKPVIATAGSGRLLASVTTWRF